MRLDLINRVIDLQMKCNLMIDTYGECDHETADELERLVDSLTWDESDELIKQYGEHLAP